MTLRKVLEYARRLQHKASQELHPWRKPEIGHANLSLTSYAKKGQRKPFLDARGDLVIPMDGDPMYHWWREGGQSILTTLLKLEASDELTCDHCR